ncbi:hypothetical protein NPIL_567601 [Nephila pilipes]|uniref:Uncharacterized protein n=1 Tax=Nephila pilipes TaxID=299642 RepID=A0A8X6PIL1_NEPPI|nr:hypothetical protein NPIL_567601 [Nephila pilipes]
MRNCFVSRQNSEEERIEHFPIFLSSMYLDGMDQDLSPYSVVRAKRGSDSKEWDQQSSIVTSSWGTGNKQTDWFWRRDSDVWLLLLLGQGKEYCMSPVLTSIYDSFLYPDPGYV